MDHSRGSSGGLGEAIDFGAAALHFVDKLNGLETKVDVLNAVQATFADFGFEHFVMTDLPCPIQKNAPHVILVKLPTGWAEHYQAQRFDLVDPVVSQVRQSSHPFVWEDARVAPETPPLALEIMHRARDHGMLHGFTLPVHGANGLTSCFSMSASLTPYMNRFTRPAIHLMAMYAFERARALDIAPEPVMSLTAREREVLTWAAAGKSAAHIADILKITERTAVAHTVNAMQKLGAANKTQAVAKALRNGLIKM
jgi:LuxR family transcriptional regulator, quorum-sensing system regulator BjaR1